MVDGGLKMVGKELKRLNRRELVEVIYQLKKNEEDLQAQISALQEQLQEKRIKISVAGSIAEATTDITQIFSVAQMTADLYLHEITCMKEAVQLECAQKLEEAKHASEVMLADSEARLNELNARYQDLAEKYTQLQADALVVEALQETK